MKNAPANFLSLYMPAFLANTIDKITNTQVGATSLEWLLARLPSNVARRYASFLKIGKSAEQIDVFRTLLDQYDDRQLRFVGLSMFMEDERRQSQTGYEGQLDGILDVKKQYPDQFLVFLGVDPRWKGSGSELRETIEKKFDARLRITSLRSVFPYVGLKIYPSTGFYVFDEKLKETFEWAADNGVPVMSHCSYLGGLYNNDKSYIETNLNPADPYTGLEYAKPSYLNEFRLGNWLLNTNTARNNKRSCSYFIEPETYRSVAKYFNDNNRVREMSAKDSWAQNYRRSIDTISSFHRMPLKICLAHYGGAGQLMMEAENRKEPAPIGISAVNWSAQIKSLMRDFEGIYTDISYTLSEQSTHDPILADLEDLSIGDRLLFGTDFFLSEQELPEKKNYLRFKEVSQAHTMVRDPSKSAWDLIASANCDRYLHSKYYNGQVI